MLIRTIAPRRARRHSATPDARTSLTLDEIWRGLRAAPAATAAGFVPRVDVSEAGDALRFVAELPGVDRGDLEVSVDDDVITIRGVKKVPRPAETGRGIRLERSSGEFSRSFRVPFEVEPESVKGVYRHGILTVTVPKPADEAVRTIPIATA